MKDCGNPNCSIDPEIQDATFVIERSYPKMNVQEDPFVYLGINERIVNLEITTQEKLPDEFYTELQILLTKFTST